MKLKFEKVFLIMSKDGQLIAKGVPRNRYIRHVDENDKSRLLTYSTKNKAISGFTDSGFYLSETATEYIANRYPELKTDGVYNKGIYWKKVQHLFEAKEFSVIYESVE